MNIRYQIFLSSTYSDLKDERAAVWEQLIKTGFIVVGMEQFPASDEEQMEYIRPLIDDSDYYVLIVRGKYGSLAGDGLSYTEKEYLYALEKEKPILVFLYKDVGNLLVNETDQDPQKLVKLNKFRQDLLDSRIVKFWEEAKELSHEVLRAVYELARRKPAKGWVRGDNAADPKIYIELEDLRKENLNLTSRIQSEESNISLPKNFRHGRDELVISYSVRRFKQDNKTETIDGPFEYVTTWDGLLGNLVEVLYREPREQTVSDAIKKIVVVKANMGEKPDLLLENDLVRSCRFQFQALGIINTFIREEENNTWGGVVVGGPKTSKYLCWELTTLGKRYIAQIRAQRREQSS